MLAVRCIKDAPPVLLAAASLVPAQSVALLQRLLQLLQAGVAHTELRMPLYSALLSYTMYCKGLLAAQTRSSGSSNEQGVCWAVSVLAS